ncbi:TetR/AcrR family transcriptional regulator [bacterium RCC_150]
MVNSPANPDPAHRVATAIELLVRQGYDSTSVGDLAGATGMSRSTFFRKFGSKEDIVFADHDRILEKVREELSRTSKDPLRTVVDAALLVFEHHVGNRETSLARYELLQQVPALRDRELVMTHRYQRAFRSYLRGALPEAGNREVIAVTFAASVVALHNSVLREWLRSGTEEDLTRRLARDLGILADTFAGLLRGSDGPGSTPAGRAAVVVTVLERAADNEAILQAVREALG